jgi:plastocyanin
VRGLTLALLLLAAVVALPGCGGGEEGGAVSGSKVDVTLDEYSIDPATIEVDETGRVTLDVKNDGDETHALVLGGTATQMIDPGSSAELTAELGDGTYTIYCPIGDHRSEGMEAKLEVGDASAGGGTGEEDSGVGGYGTG